MPEEGYLDVDGARLYHRSVGSGPVLLLLPGGDGDADTSAALVDRLSARHTVVTYDRRGLSRSVPDDPDEVPGVALHADDAAALLRAVTDRPADVFGSSIGAVIGLELLCRHPGRVRLLLAHEPPLTQFLPEADRARAVAAQLAVESAFASGGPITAMPALAGLAGFDVNDREPDAELPRPGPGRARNLAFFLGRDAPVVRDHEIEVDALRAVADQVVLAAGTGSGGAVQPGRIARLMAEQLHCRLIDFPGEHNAPVFRPAGVAALISEVFDS